MGVIDEHNDTAYWFFPDQRFNEKGDVVDNMAIDWQLLMVSTPAIDVQYFINSSANIKSIMTKFNDWIKMYHDALTMELELFGLKAIYSFEEFMKDIEHSHYHAFLMSFIHLMVS